VLASWNGNVSVQSWNQNTGNVGGIWTFAGDGGTIFPTLTVQRGDNPSGTISGQTLLFGSANSEAIISTPDGVAGNEYSQRLVINPGAGNNYGEGGDIYLWAGRGGDGSGSGGDIKIRGGQGGANTVGGSGGDGGYIRIDAGDAAYTGGNPGYIDITGGYSNTVGGYVNVTGGQGAAVGGDVKIYGGYGSATGGNVNIWGGASGNGQVNEGQVNIQTGGNTWTFDSLGNLTLPANTFAVNYANGDPVTFSGGGGNTGNVTFDDNTVIGTGDEYGGSGLYLAPGANSIGNVQYLRVRGGDFPTHIHLDTGNNQYFDQYFGDDGKYVKLANTGNIVINSDDNIGNSAQWTFDTNGNLTVPSGGSILSIGSNGIGVTANATSGNAYLALGDAASQATLSGNVGVNIVTNGNIIWSFNADGKLTLPNGAVIKDTAGNAVAFGLNAGNISQGIGAVAIGELSGNNTQGNLTVAIGYNAGSSSQGTEAIAIGTNAGYESQQVDAVAIGASSGGLNQGYRAVSIGMYSGGNAQGVQSVAVGYLAGYTNQGTNSIAIGANAGATSQAVNSIILNATGAALDQTTANTFTVKPVRGDSTGNLVGAGFVAVYYNPTTGEFAYASS
jgi:hypothetical protein